MYLYSLCRSTSNVCLSSCTVFVKRSSMLEYARDCAQRLLASPESDHNGVSVRDPLRRLFVERKFVSAHTLWLAESTPTSNSALLELFANLPCSYPRLRSKRLCFSPAEPLINIWNLRGCRRDLTITSPGSLVGLSRSRPCSLSCSEATRVRSASYPPL
ncbi:hypothetical protein FKP32DRAFT_1431578 [Trametes sanguinea]|nr:hypothetical protein FKP32DRAFT_1431578 [Trametes sanguinea]